MPSVPKPPTTRAASPCGLSGIRRSRKAFVSLRDPPPFHSPAGLLTPTPLPLEKPALLAVCRGSEGLNRARDAGCAAAYLIRPPGLPSVRDLGETMRLRRALGGFTGADIQETTLVCCTSGPTSELKTCRESGGNVSRGRGPGSRG